MHKLLLRAPALRAWSLLLFTVASASMSAAALGAPPTISGAPPTVTTVGSWYVFLPRASDPDTPRRRLRYTVANKPAWASFSIYNGALYGRPNTAGVWSNIRIMVTDGRSRVALPAFSVRAMPKRAPRAPNRAPLITGSPSAVATPGVTYSFTPTARDPDGDRLTFSISNRPAWASFDSSTGRLSGRPTSANLGAHSNIRITVRDGLASAALSPFQIIVSDAAAASGSATLTWTPPTRNTNGAALTNLAGYRIYYGTSASVLNRTIDVRNPGVATYVIDELAPGAWYFAVRAYNSAGVESALSNVASKTVR